MRVVCFTCDQYSYIVPTFVQFFHQMWPNCPWPLTIVTDSLPIKVKEKVLMMRAGRHFSNRLSTYMDGFGMQDEHILVMLEDYIVKQPVNHALVMRAYGLMQTNPNIGMVRLYPKPGPTAPLDNDPEIGVIQRGDLYVASLQAALWRSDVFRGILGVNEDPWETEEAGSWRARRMPDNVTFLGTKEAAIDYHNYCSKGVLDLEVTKWVKENSR